MTVLATVIAGMVGVLGPAAPAHADEPGLGCTSAAMGTLSAPSPAQYGQFITVGWSVTQTWYCPAPVVYIVGPSFGGAGETLPLGGSRRLRAVTDGTTMTWSLYLYDMQTDSQTPVRLAVRTITVP